MIDAKERLAALLSEVEAPGSFSARRTAPVDDLHLEVRGIGPIELPVSEEQARALRGLGRPARYGLGDKTLLDTQVRDTAQVPLSRVKIDQRRWAKTLKPILDDLGADLGLPTTRRLKAELHSMLVYGPGQFFLPHQDSEKDDAMVGSLVVTLPSSHKGGSLVVTHRGESVTYRAPRKPVLSFVAFYADCVHEVRPVTAGHRLTLTYNVMVEGDRTDVDLPPGQVDDLAACLREYFGSEAPAGQRYAALAEDGTPRRLAYLLDHQYTARGFDWSRLKGSDAATASALQAAAAQAGCELVLGLAEVHETWDCLEPEPPSHRSWGHHDWDDWDDEDNDWEPDGSADDWSSYELRELIDSEISLVCWADGAEGEPTSLSLTIHPSQVCAAVPSVEFEPYASEYEGYMGNYGNTMDRWYRRAALVMWPAEQGFAARAEALPSWAVDSLLARVRAGSVAEARDLAATLAPFWPRAAGSQRSRTFFGRSLQVARGIDDPTAATMLLAPLQLEMLGRRGAPTLASLADRYGEPWLSDLLQGWFARSTSWNYPGTKGPSREEWISALPDLCAALSRAGEPGLLTARVLAAETWRWLRQLVARLLEVRSPSQRTEGLAALASPIAAVLLSVTTVGADDLLNEAVSFLCSGRDELLGCLLQALRSAAARGGSAPVVDGPPSAFGTLATYCRERLSARLARPPRAADDWSVALPAGCGCELCTHLGAFLADRNRRSLDWPLAKDGRQHIHGRIDAAELPVLHATRRQGRPFTLVLTKTQALFEEERRARLEDEVDLAWLGPAGPGATARER